VVDPGPILTPQGTEDSGSYRPVSGLAIAGLALSALYAALVVVSAVAALIQRAPFFLSSWMIFLAIGGVILSGLAMWHIRKAEGTRAGLKVARWGLWLSVVTGSVYTAYAVGTRAAVTQQANYFLTVPGEDSGFFPLLEKGELTRAFLLTYPYTRRAGSDPDNDDAMRAQFDTPLGPNPTGYLSQFLKNNLIRCLYQAHREKGEVHVEPGGVKSWDYTAKGYRVDRKYRITTPEVILDVVMVVQSSESDSPGGGRKWFVVMPESGYAALERTPAGRKMHELRQKAGEFVDAALSRLQRTGALVKTENLRAPPGAPKLEIQADFKQILKEERATTQPSLLKMDDPAFAVWEINQAGKLQISHGFQIMLLRQNEHGDPRFMGFGHIIVETDVPGDPREIDFTPQWRLVEVDLERAVPLPRAKP